MDSEQLSSHGTVTALIEVPKWSFIKRGSTDHVDFVSPLPCPYNYGAVPEWIGLDGDLLDVLVLGPRLERGSEVDVNIYASIGMSERGLYDDKLIAAAQPPSRAEADQVLRFFHAYAFCKGLLNVVRRAQGPFARCEGWGDPAEAIERCSPRADSWRGPRVPF